MANRHQKWVEDMTPVCKECHKVAPIREDVSDENWTVYDTSGLCECGGRYVARFMVEVDDG